MASILSAGIVAPNFTLRVTPDQNLTLSDLKGKNVIIAFYPADWSPVCGDQVTLYNVQGLRYAEDNECCDLTTIPTTIEVLPQG